VAQDILSAPPGGVAAVIAAALNDAAAPIRRDPRAFTMFSTRCRKKGEWAKCVEIFDAMRAQGVETNTIVYNATMSACSKGGQWERALAIFDTMPGDGLARSTISYNVAMSACMRGGDWARALRLFDEMAAAGLERDHVSVNSAMAAAEAGGQQDRMEALAGGAGKIAAVVPGGGATVAAVGSVGSSGGGSGSGGSDVEGENSGSDEEEEKREDPGASVKQGVLGSDGGRTSMHKPKENNATAASAEEKETEEEEEEVVVEEHPGVKERRLKAQRKDARREKFEVKRRERKAAKLSRPWVTGDGDGDGAEGAARTRGTKRLAGVLARALAPATLSKQAEKRKEWGSNPLKWIDDDEGMGKRRGKDAASDDDDEEDEDDEYDGPPPITGPSLMDADDEEAKPLLNFRHDRDDFWASGF
jgi:pentatricopeptide repeat protein